MSAVSDASPTVTESRFGEVSSGRAEEFGAKGCERRYFFPHRVYRLPKCGPDAYKLAGRMCGECDLDQIWELVIYASPALAAEFPAELFFDRELIWHEQHFGLPGQVASANLVVFEDRVCSFVHISDLVQRIGLRREHKTRVDNRFKGWPRMLVNAIVDFARERGVAEVRVPTSRLAMLNTDRSRTVEAELFERVYDRSLRQLEGVGREDDWWVVDVARNEDRVVIPESRVEDRPRPSRTVALCHDLERGLGHLDVDPEFARHAETTSRESLTGMLAAEREAGVRATYNVVGELLPEVRDELEADGHCVAFHSWDHERPGGTDDQLLRCRELDYRIKGYRPPRSAIGPDLSDERLAFHNFEWLASSTASLGIDVPELSRRLVRIPIHMDDFSLHSQGRAYDDWEREALALVERQPFTALCLHDCYAERWLPGYGRLLERLRELATLRTLDEVAADVTLAAAAW